MKKKKIKVTYKSNLDTATPEQKKEFQQRLDEAYEILFQKVIDKKARELSVKR